MIWFLGTSESQNTSVMLLTTCLNRSTVSASVAAVAYAIHKVRKMKQENKENGESFPLPKDMFKAKESPSKKSVPMTEALLASFREIPFTMVDGEAIGV